METEHQLKTTGKETRKALLRIGCSGALFYTLNREFGYPVDEEEKASAALAGGIMQAGNQCGMLWGAALAAGAESFRRSNNMNMKIILAVHATQGLMESYFLNAKCINCRDFTRADFMKGLDMIRYMLFRARKCFVLASKWAPKAYFTAHEKLNNIPDHRHQEIKTCATEVVRKLGGTKKQMIMVSGFAGGMGLSGEGCGALAAAIWMKSMELVRKNNGKSLYGQPGGKQILKDFSSFTDSKFSCAKICGRRFRTIEEHSGFVQSGGCHKLIDILGNL